MIRLHANVYVCPDELLEGRLVELRGQQLDSLQGLSGGPPQYLATMPVTFEQMQQDLLQNTNSDCEPDGFFLITGREQGAFWRLNGHMHEFQPEGSDSPMMHRVELNGECPESIFDSVLGAMGWPNCKLAFELVQEGISLGEQQLRQYARSDTT